MYETLNIRAHFAVWLDLVSPGTPVPAFNGVVVLKVSRLSADPSSTEGIGSAAAASMPAPVAARATAPAPAPVRAPTVSVAPRQQPVDPTADVNADVLGLFDSGPASSAPPASGPTRSAGGVSAGGAGSSSSSSDIFSLSAAVDSPSAAPLNVHQPGRGGFGSGGAAATPPASAAPAAGLRGTPGMALGGGLARGGPPVAAAASSQASRGGAANILAGDVFSL